MTTSIYASICGLVLIWLAAQTIKRRRANKVRLGDGGVFELQSAIRAHGNFTEYMPITLILLFFVEQNGLNTWLVHVVGLSFIASRTVHAKGLLQNNLQLRMAGMVATFTVIALLALANFALVILQKMH